MKETDPKKLVRKGYDRVSFAYRADDCDVDSSEYAAWLALLGFSLLREQFIPEGNGGHPLFFACRNKPPFSP